MKHFLLLFFICSITSLFGQHAIEFEKNRIEKSAIEQASEVNLVFVYTNNSDTDIHIDSIMHKGNTHYNLKLNKSNLKAGESDSIVLHCKTKEVQQYYGAICLFDSRTMLGCSYYTYSVVYNQNSIQKKNLPQIEVGHDSHIDLGRISAGIYTYSIPVTNTGKSDLNIFQVRTDCGCVIPEWTKTPIKAGENGKITLKIEVSMTTSFRKKLIIMSNSYLDASFPMDISAEVFSYLTEFELKKNKSINLIESEQNDTIEIDLGLIKLGELKQFEFLMENTGKSPLHIGVENNLSSPKLFVFFDKTSGFDEINKIIKIENKLITFPTLSYCANSNPHHYLIPNAFKNGKVVYGKILFYCNQENIGAFSNVLPINSNTEKNIFLKLKGVVTKTD